jgi:hypothetical protein
MSKPRKRIFYGLLTVAGVCLAGVITFYCYGGSYGINVVLRRGASIWLSISENDQRISNSMRMALREPPPAAVSGKLEWQPVADGFEVAELPVLADGSAVDQVLLARIDPALYRFHVHNTPAGNREPADWIDNLGAVFVINGSYFARDGTPETPLLSLGTFLGPAQYDARHGAFVASATSVAVVDLDRQDWRQAFRGATDAMVSYPLLIDAAGACRAKGDRRWLANRSFVGEDDSGHIVLGTTKDAFFSLDRFGAFLKQSPLRLRLALNLDGGPVACQGIRIGDFHRDFCGTWETAVHDGQLKLLSPLVGKRRWGLPIVLAVSRK